jgi:hypothetical protein
MVRLLVLSLALYYAVFRWIARPLHAWLEDATRDHTVERTVLLYTLLLYAFIGLLLVILGMAIDYAKAALIVEKRRSSVLAFLRGLSFVFSHPLRTLALYGLLLAVGALVVGAYMLLARGPGQLTMFKVAAAFLFSQAYIGARLFLKLWFLGSQTALFLAAGQPESPPHSDAAAVAA